MSGTGPGWSADQAAAFHEAFTAHGQDFEKISAACGKPAEECETLYRRQHAYLSIPAELQSAPAFAAMVEAAQKDEPVKEEPPASQQRSRSLAAGEDGGEASGAAGSRRPDSSGEEGEEGEEEEEEPGLAAGRSRRTPKRGGMLTPSGRAAGRRTPVAGAKRGRAGGEDIYEYYDDGGTRAASRGLDYGSRGGRRRQDTDEAKGIDALLALAVAGEESLGDGLDSEEDHVPPRKKAARRTPQRRRHVADDEDESEEEPADAGAMYDQADEDFAPRQRRTPYSTPAKGRLPRPGSAHTTPRRTGSRGAPHGGLPGPSPGLALRGLSPYMLGPGLEGGDMMDLALGDLGYIASPGFQQFAPGFVPSPQNPMPRLRRRKSLPERVPAAVASPIKTLFTRRSSLAGGPALMSSFGFPAATGGDEGSAAVAAAAAAAPPPQTAGEAALRHCLQQPKTQRWAAAEFCCSALDRPFFMFNPLAGLLTALGLGEDAQLTRKEWSLLRASLGKPRRLSLKFLKEERARLEHWREGCRQQYQSGAAALADPKVADHLPRPLAVGQRVVARHPTTRQLHDGQVLTAAHNCYRVQFDRQELGVELVRDTDVMPAEPAENLPPALLRGRLLLNGRQVVNGQPLRPFAPRLPLPTPGLPAALAAAAAATPLTVLPAVLPPSSAQPDSSGAAASSAAAAAAATGQQQAGQQLQQQSKSTDAKALAELVVGLDKKEALLLQLRSMNDEAAAGMHTDPAAPGRGAAPQFVTAYANVVLQLKEVNEKVQEQLESMDRPSSSGELAGGAAAVSAPLDAVLQHQLQTPEALSESALAEARAIIDTCRRKLAESAAEASVPQPDAAAGEAAAAAAASDGAQADAAAAASDSQLDAAASPSSSQQTDFWTSADGQRLGALIESCVHSLVLLQQGATSSALPPAALTAALDGALAAVRPRSAANQQLYEEIQEAMKGLKLQIAS